MRAVGLNPSEVGGGTSTVLVGPPDMPDCDPLAVVVQAYGEREVVVLSRWQPSEEDRQAIAGGADILLYVWGGQPPVALGTIQGEHE